MNNATINLTIKKPQNKMKRTTWILAATILIVSCTKDREVNLLPKIKKEDVYFAPAPLPINIIPNNIVSNNNVAGVETFTYSDGSVARVSGLGKINISMSKGGKTDYLTGTDITMMGVRTIKLYTNNNLYHSYVINSAGDINNLFIDFRYYPYPNTHPTGKDPYLRCMQDYYNKCVGSWKCRLMFFTSQFGVIGAGLGWSAGCLLGVKP